MKQCEDNNFGRVKVPKTKDLGIFTNFSDFIEEKKMKVWLAEYIHDDEFDLVGIRFTKYEAFLDCWEDYKERKQILEGLNRKDSKELRLFIIKDLKHYFISEYEIIERK